MSFLTDLYLSGTTFFTLGLGDVTPLSGVGRFLVIMRGMWDNTGKEFTYQGRVYTVKEANPGPAPAHRIPIWTAR
jgi:alkanesulfonate monooxygenase SsuD/methylene tetrahydromethanopterin reductase-like flavin-dependent oxidoreductase (luciferase family)